MNEQRIPSINFATATGNQHETVEKASAVANVSLGRSGTPADIAGAPVFIAPTTAGTSTALSSLPTASSPNSNVNTQLAY